MPVFTLKTSHGGRPRTYYTLEVLLAVIEEELVDKVKAMGAGKIIIEVKPEKPGKGG